MLWVALQAMWINSPIRDEHLMREELEKEWASGCANSRLSTRCKHKSRNVSKNKTPNYLVVRGLLNGSVAPPGLEPGSRVPETLILSLELWSQMQNRHIAAPTLTKWWISESNRWPLACHASALANWANPPQPDSFETDGKYTWILSWCKRCQSLICRWF